MNQVIQLLRLEFCTLGLRNINFSYLDHRNTQISPRQRHLLYKRLTKYIRWRVDYSCNIRTSTGIPCENAVSRLYSPVAQVSAQKDQLQHVQRWWPRGSQDTIIKHNDVGRHNGDSVRTRAPPPPNRSVDNTSLVIIRAPRRPRATRTCWKPVAIYWTSYSQPRFSTWTSYITAILDDIDNNRSL